MSPRHLFVLSLCRRKDRVLLDCGEAGESACGDCAACGLRLRLEVEVVLGASSEGSGRVRV